MNNKAITTFTFSATMPSISKGTSLGKERILNLVFIPIKSIWRYRRV